MPFSLGFSVSIIGGVMIYIRSVSDCGKFPHPDLLPKREGGLYFLNYFFAIFNPFDLCQKRAIYCCHNIFKP